VAKESQQNHATEFVMKIVSKDMPQKFNPEKHARKVDDNGDGIHMQGILLAVKKICKDFFLTKLLHHYCRNMYTLI